MNYIKNYDDEIRDGWIISSQKKKLQNTLLTICDEVERICSKHNIIYWGAFGTLLGVKQYSGFIPWDNDIDLNMLRPEYNRFCKVLKDELNTDYFDIVLYTPFFIKIAYRNATYIRSNKNFCQNDLGKVVVDITPLDSGYDGKSLESKFVSNKLFELRCFALRKNISDDEFAEINALCDKVYGQSEYINEAKRFKEIGVSKSLYANTVKLPFEMFNMPCPVGYKEICYHYYGNFEKKIDDYHCDLNSIFVNLPKEYVEQNIDYSLYGDKK